MTITNFLVTFHSFKFEIAILSVLRPIQLLCNEYQKLFLWV